MNNLRTILKLAVAIVMIVMVSSCTKNDDSAGYEYTPDMYRSPAIEAYVDYGIYKDKEHAELKVLQSARLPGLGSIPYNPNKAEAAINMPYAYADNQTGYEAAGLSLRNPLDSANSEANLAEGKRLFSFMCTHCHGPEGKGDGAVVVKAGHAPPNAFDGGLSTLPEGKMFHTLTYGKGVMGSHASQLSKKERWQIIMHVKTLQGNTEVPDTNGTVIVPVLGDSTNG